MRVLRRLILRILIILPWLGWLWLISLGLNDQIDGLLTFVLAIIIAPLIGVINVTTYVLIEGKRLIRRAHRAREPLKSQNYAELAWWHPKRWFN